MKITPGQKAILNALLHELLRLRDGDKCLRCSGRVWLQMSHIYPKGTHRRLEFDPTNLKLLCHKCHIPWWHANPKEAWDWLEATLPKDRLHKLRAAAYSTARVTMDYHVQKHALEAEIARLKAN